MDVIVLRERGFECRKTCTDLGFMGDYYYYYYCIFTVILADWAVTGSVFTDNIVEINLCFSLRYNLQSM